VSTGRNRRLALAAAWLVTCLVLSLPAHADDPPWPDLTPAQRGLLAPLRAHWPDMDADEQAQWLALTARADHMPADERARLQARIGDWARLSPGQRGQARLQYQQAQRWDASDRRARWEAYQSLHPEARKVLADRWRLEAGARDRSGAPDGGDKRNLVELAPPPPAPPRTATPTTVRAPSGATTQPLTRRIVEAPSPLQHGLPKVQASESLVDPVTLLPRRGPQAAAMVRVPDAAASRPGRRRR